MMHQNEIPHWWNGRHTLVRMLSDGTERPATDSEVSRVRRGITDASPPAAPAGAASGAEERCAGAAGACKHEVGVMLHLV